MTKKEFKERWESSADGGGITFDDIADCAVEWGIYQQPRVIPIYSVRYRVLVAAGTSDAEYFNPDNEDDDD